MRTRITFMLLALLLTLIGCGGTDSHSPGPGGHGAGATDSTEVPFDVMFIDGMIVHHRGAITMAEQVLVESERPELRQLAEAIIAAQQPEIDQLTAWRNDWYPDQPATEVSELHMGDMAVSSDTKLPFDQRFLTAMISHHEGAIVMARDAQQQAEHPEIKQLAGQIIAAQQAEIAQMQQWLTEWFGQ